MENFKDMENIFLRTEMLIGADSVKTLKTKKVIVFGVGGVGSAAVEALARAGVGSISLVDNDTVNVTNINRQLIATHSTVGRPKTEVAKERVLDINPNAEVTCFNLFFTPENAGNINLEDYDYIIDAVDTVTAKIHIICEAERLGVPVISSMGTGNKLDPSAFTVADIYKTSVCPLARVMRTELKKRGVKKLKVVYSEEQPQRAGNRTPASISFVPPVAGFIAAGEVIKDLIKDE